MVYRKLIEGPLPEILHPEESYANCQHHAMAGGGCIPPSPDSEKIMLTCICGGGNKRLADYESIKLKDRDSGLTFSFPNLGETDMMLYNLAAAKISQKVCKGCANYKPSEYPQPPTSRDNPTPIISIYDILADKRPLP